MNAENYNKKVKKIERQNAKKLMKSNLKKLKYKSEKKLEANKIFAIYLFVLLNAIVIFAMVVMWKYGDLTALDALITSIVGEVLTYGIYCLKAFFGKREEEKMRFERDKYIQSDTYEEETEEDV